MTTVTAFPFPAADVAALLSITWCVVATAFVANRVRVRDHARLFSSLVLLALGWATLFPYYTRIIGPTGVEPRLHILPAFQGILLALAGGPLRREAVARNSGQSDPRVEALDLWMFRALSILVVISIVSIASIGYKVDRPLGIVLLVLGIIFEIVGYGSIGHGACKLTESGSNGEYRVERRAIQVIVLVYAVAVIYWASDWTRTSHAPDTNSPMAPALKWIFAGVKVAFAAVFLRIVALKAQSDVSCFISYSNNDKDFTRRLRIDLRADKVRCWYAEEDLHRGKIAEVLHKAIRDHDMVLLILSTDSMKSEWVKREIVQGLKREANEHRQVLFPIRITSQEEVDNWRCIDESGKDLAAVIREYYIHDFSRWKEYEEYQIAFKRLLKGLRPESAEAAGDSRVTYEYLDRHPEMS